MPVFSFRAECRPDAEVFISDAQQAGIASSATYYPDDIGCPDVDVEAVFDASLEQLRAVLRQREDTHIILQTLREQPLAGNSLERDYGLV